MKRVLLTVHKFFPTHRAGTEVLTLKVAQELTKRGFEVLVVCANPPDLDARLTESVKASLETADYVYDGVRVHVVEEALRLNSYTFAHEYNHPQIAQHFKKILQEFAPDIVHVFHAQNLSASIIEEANAAGIAVVMSTTDFWFVCPIVQLKRPDGAICRGPSKGALNCLTCYTPKLFAPLAEFKEAFGQKYSALTNVLNKLPANNFFWQALYGIYGTKKLKGAVVATCQRPGFLQKAANSVKAIMVPTKLMRDIFIENGINADLIHHVSFGIDTEPLVAYQKKSASDILRIGFIGTLFEHKGVDLLVKALQLLPANAPCNLTIWGDPEQFPEYGHELMELAASVPDRASKITFAGTFPNSQLGPVLSNIDVLVVPSRWYENTPLVMQSALATKTPLVVTDLGGMSELIKDGINGFTFQLNNEKSLASALQKFLDDPQLLARMRDNIPPEKNVAQMVDEIEAIYGTLPNASRADKQSSPVLS
jgi:glycosyltransferase involved in cell wall biosynthesis